MALSPQPADHRHHPPSFLQPPDRAGLPGWQHPGDDLADAHPVTDRLSGEGVVAGEQHRRQAIPRSLATASGEVGLIMSATTSTPRTCPSQPANTAVCPAASASAAPGRQHRWDGLCPLAFNPVPPQATTA